MSRVTIQFEGSLKTRFPDPIIIEAPTIRGALLALAAIPGHTRDDSRTMVKVDKAPCYAALDEPLPSTETLTVIPVLAGSGGGDGGQQILIGALVIGLAFATGGASLAAGELTAGFLGQMAINIGASMILGGAMRLLASSPKADPTSGDKKSRFLSGEKNTVNSGTPIPLLYGEFRQYGHYLSIDINSEDYTPA